MKRNWGGAVEEVYLRKVHERSGGLHFPNTPNTVSYTHLTLPTTPYV